MGRDKAGLQIERQSFLERISGELNDFDERLLLLQAAVSLMVRIVIRQEDTDEGEETVCIYTPLTSYEN